MWCPKRFERKEIQEMQWTVSKKIWKKRNIGYVVDVSKKIWKNRNKGNVVDRDQKDLEEQK